MKGVYLISIIIKRTQECCHITFASSKKITPPQTEDRFMSSYLENSELSYFHLIWFLQTLETLFALITDGYIFILQRLLLGGRFSLFFYRAQTHDIENKQIKHSTVCSSAHVISIHWL